MLKLTLIGHIGNDAEVRDVANRKVISFNVAHTEKYTDRNGQRQETTTWVRCSYFRDPDKTAIAQYLKKGTQVFVEGTPALNTYTNKEGKEVTSLECRVSSMELLGGRAGSAEGQRQETNYAQPQQQQKQKPSFAEGGGDTGIDDLPF